VRRSLRRALVIALASVLILAGAAAAGNAWLGVLFATPGPGATAVRTQVESGATVRSILTRLESLGVLKHARLMELYLRLHGRHLAIKAGEYEIAPHATPQAIVAMLAEGRVVLEQLTVVEGSTFADFRRGLEAHPKVRAMLKGKSDAEVMAAIGHPGELPEGRFFPDTFRFAGGTSDAEILKLAYVEMQQVLAAAWAARSADLPVHSAYEALTLASIVEKETGLASERPLIAGVFTSRLRKGMRLQSDPTVIYGLGAQYDGSIHDRDLVTDTPYNTYTRAGLPPTPIALPGRESLLAATRPEVTGALYFVATGTGDGGHHFSATLAEHDVALRAYLRHLGVAPGRAPNAEHRP